MSRDYKIFVFGSNKSGIHGAGAAKTAYDKYGAEWGVGEGPTGLCYALPTKGYEVEYISLKKVKKAVDNFTKFASNIPNDFQVTQIGCGLGGFTKEEIAPLFEECVELCPNCYFDTKWSNLLPSQAKFWGTF